MRVVRKLTGIKFKEPKPAPCGHIPPTFLLMSGKYATIVMHPHDTEYVKIQPAVWCPECGLVKVTLEDFEYYKEFNGAQES